MCWCGLPRCSGVSLDYLAGRKEDEEVELEPTELALAGREA